MLLYFIILRYEKGAVFSTEIFGRIVYRIYSAKKDRGWIASDDRRARGLYR